MPDEPAFGTRDEACPKLVGTAVGFEEGRIDQLDVDAAALHRRDRARDLDQLAGGSVGYSGALKLAATGLSDIDAAFFRGTQPYFTCNRS